MLCLQIIQVRTLLYVFAPKGDLPTSTALTSPRRIRIVLILKFCGDANKTIKYEHVLLIRSPTTV